MKLVRLALVSAALFVLPACVGAEDVELEEEIVDGEMSPALVDLRAKLPSPTIHVGCEPTPANQARGRRLAKAAIMGTWDAASALRFVGWGKCTPNDRGLRIAVKNEGPHTRGNPTHGKLSSGDKRAVQRLYGR